MSLTSSQKAQIEKQFTNHQHQRYMADIVLTDGEILKNFIIEPNVYRSDIMSAGIYLARWLFFHNGLYQDKDVLDMGCGSGLQGMVMALYGAKSIILTDISSEAVANTRENIKQYKLKNSVKVVQGDLFENVESKFDVIVFNHPFFPDNPLPDKPVSRSMLDKGDLLQRFLSEAKRFLKPDGVIISPFLDLAGDINNPATLGPKYSYAVETCFTCQTKAGIQPGKFSVYKLSKVSYVARPAVISLY
jgi:tRNA1(Val) A37 N6-methylase TrmN6